MYEASPTINPGLKAWFGRLQLRSQLKHERAIQQQAQQKKNVNAIATKLIDSAQRQLFGQKSLCEKATRSMFGGISLRAIDRLIQKELKARGVSYVWHRVPSDDPAVIKVAISIPR